MSKPRKLGPFDVGKQLGVGGMGVVYLATYRETGQKVALKILAPALCADKKLISRFEREIDILKKLEHPNIVRYFGGGRAGEQRYYAMEYMDGGSLDAVLESKGQLTWEQTIRIGLQLCSALEHAHAHGIVHRDLKPGNLFINKKGRLRLGDFGIARDNDATALTAAGKTVGTYAYMAPEQIHGKNSIGPKTDIYAMGCLLYQFLTGSVPFPGNNAAEMFMKHLNDQPDSVCEHNLDCPIWLDRVIQRMLEKEPEDRPFDALAVHTLLEDVRTRVSDQSSMAQQAMTSGPVDTVVTDRDRADLKQAIGSKKKKKRKKKGPFYERAWFLLLCLALLIGGVTWRMWPNEQRSFDEIADAMTDPYGRLNVEDKIADYLADFEDGAHIREVTEFRDQLEMEQAESRILSRVKRGDKLTDAETSFRQANEYEDLGDRLTAIEQYQAIVQLFQDTEENRPVVNLARKRIEEIESAPTTDRVKTVIAALRKADRSGDLIKSKVIWESIIRLYRDNRELGRQLDYAQRCLDALAAGEATPKFEFDEPQDDAPAPNE